MLAIIEQKGSDVVIWDTTSKTTQKLETGVQGHLTFIQWSKLDRVLAIGTSKGMLVLYNYKTKRITPHMGKHGNKPICNGCWSEDNILCLGGDDTSTQCDIGHKGPWC